jgi:hypothetical protein
VLQRRPEIPPHHGRPCFSHRNRDVTVVHADAPQMWPSDALGACIHASLRPEVQAAM